MRSFLFLLMLLPGAVLAQSQDYVVLASGDTLRGRVEVRSPLLKRTYVQMDTLRFDLDELLEVREGEATMAVVENGRLASLVRRGGRVDFYAYTRTLNTPGMMVPSGAPGGGMTMTGGSSSSSEIGFYRLDGGPIQRASPGNLRLALADNDASMRALSQHQTLTYAQYGTMAAGLGMLGGGLALSFDQSTESEFKPHPLLFVGAGLTAVSNLIFPGQRRAKVRQAIDAYNE